MSIRRVVKGGSSCQRLGLWFYQQSALTGCLPCTSHSSKCPIYSKSWLLFRLTCMMTLNSQTIVTPSLLVLGSNTERTLPMAAHLVIELGSEPELSGSWPWKLCSFPCDNSYLLFNMHSLMPKEIYLKTVSGHREILTNDYFDCS